MVFQNYGLYPHMTVAESIGYPLKVRGIGGDDRDQRVKRAAEKVELGALLARYPRELSGGRRMSPSLHAARAISTRRSMLLVTLVVGNERLAARADRDLALDMGESVGVKIVTRRLHLFDAATSLRP